MLIPNTTVGLVQEIENFKSLQDCSFVDYKEFRIRTLPEFLGMIYNTRIEDKELMPGENYRHAWNNRQARDNIPCSHLGFLEIRKATEEMKHSDTIKYLEERPGWDLGWKTNILFHFTVDFPGFNKNEHKALRAYCFLGNDKLYIDVQSLHFLCFPRYDEIESLFNFTSAQIPIASTDSAEDLSRNIFKYLVPVYQHILELKNLNFNLFGTRS